MRWPWQQAAPTQSTTDQLITVLLRRIDSLEHGQKQLQAEADEWITKYRTLYARTCKAAERVERFAAQEPAGPTIVHQDGVTPPPPAPDRWTRLRDAKAAHAAANGRPS